jgi:DHA2 family multidrug resistance protein
MHSRLAEHITPFNDSLTGISSAAGLAGLDASVTRQAAMIAYNNDFKLMLLLTICAVPLVALLRPAVATTKSEPAVLE